MEMETSKTAQRGKNTSLFIQFSQGRGFSLHNASVLSARVVFLIHFAQSLSADMGINLGGCDLSVSQH